VINLTWTDNSNNEDGFQIDRSTSSDFAANLVTSSVGANIRSFSSTGLAAGTTYYYRVRATSASLGNSTNSNTASATTQGTTTGTAVTSFTLINADTDQDIMTMTEGMTISLSSLPTRNLNIRANVSGIVESVRFNIDGTIKTENTPPYALYGD